MKVMVINGNTKKSGFIAEALELTASCLEQKGAEVRAVHLVDMNIEDCRGCFQCLKTGDCIIKDDMDRIASLMLAADGFVIGSPVRNEDVTACFKRFYERITYRLGFPLLLEDKYTLAISCVGFMGGKAVNKRLVGLQDVCHTRLSDFLFFKVGIPTKIKPVDKKEIFFKAAEKLMGNIEARTPRSLAGRWRFALDRFILNRFLFAKKPEIYANVVRSMKEKGYMK